MGTDRLRIGDYIPKHPIIQGGMGIRVSLSNLASSVANCGGIGVIAATGIGISEPDFNSNFHGASERALIKEIKRARKKTRGIIGINALSVLNNFSQIIQTAISEKIDIIFSGAGLPFELPKYLTSNSRTALVPIVSSSKAAYLMIKRWMKRFNYIPDAIVLEGTEAGGHLGFKKEEISDSSKKLEKVLPEVLKVVKETSGKTIPVIAAGGIYTKEDMEKFIEMGASGVQLGTRFVATEECEVSDEFKQSYIDCKEADIKIIQSPVGLPGRVISNRFIDDVESGLKKPYKCPYHCIRTCKVQDSPFCIADALMHAQCGNLEHGFVFAGANAHRINKIQRVKDVFDDLVGGC